MRKSASADNHLVNQTVMLFGGCPFPALLSPDQSTSAVRHECCADATVAVWTVAVASSERLWRRLDTWAVLHSCIIGGALAVSRRTLTKAVGQ